MSVSPLAQPSDNRPERVPTSVYRYYDKYDVLLYVGITSRGVARNMEHNHSKEWFRFVTRQEVEHHKSRGAALNRENELIRNFRPPFNKQGNPSYEAVREAYYLFRETPRSLRADFLRGRRNEGGATAKLPKTLHFRTVWSLKDVVRLELTTPVSMRHWCFAEVKTVSVKNHNHKAIGQLLDATHNVDGTAVIELVITRGGLPAGIAVGVRWPPPGGMVCQILNLQAVYKGDLH